MSIGQESVGATGNQVSGRRLGVSFCSAVHSITCLDNVDPVAVRHGDNKLFSLIKVYLSFSVLNVNKDFVGEWIGGNFETLRLDEELRDQERAEETAKVTYQRKAHSAGTQS